MSRVDVIIMGAGIAGGTLARQLRRAHPNLHIVVLEAAETMRDFKVGESTVEIAASYLNRTLGLGSYLYEHQLPKNGLRFFFDSQARDLPLPEMTEMGSDHFGFHPSFQLERAKLERDLVTMNLADGVDVRMGAKVTAIDVGTGNDPHTVSYEQDGTTHRVSARWLVDATGRRHRLQKSMGRAVHRDDRHRTAAAWARFRGVKGLDAVADRAWRTRVNHTTRHLSTNHFMYDGYWIWFIPLAGELMSVGVVWDKDRLPNGPQRQADLIPFLNRHRSSRDLLVGAELEDFRSFVHLPFHSDQYFSTDRWALTGEAGAFVDPFYSPGSDFIAVANDYITTLVGFDLAGETDEFAMRCDLYNKAYATRYETFVRTYQGLYPTFGSFELFRLKYYLDFNSYFNLMLWPYLAGQLTEPAFLRQLLMLSPLVTQTFERVGSHLRGLALRLSERSDGAYYRLNRGHYEDGFRPVAHLERRVLQPVDFAAQKAELDRSLGSLMAQLLAFGVDMPELAERQRIQEAFGVPDALRFERLDHSSLPTILDGAAARLRRELGKAFPGAAIETIRFDQPAAPTIALSASADGELERAVREHADAWWKAEARLPYAPVTARVG